MSQEEAKVAEPVAEEQGAAAEEEVKEEESNAHFEPLVKLEEVEVKSGEEEEEVLYTHRAKLFIFGETLLDVGTGNKTWKERGVGEARLLRHRETGVIRMLMRQERILKIIANFVLIPGIVLVPNVGSDKSWCWTCSDFADGESLVETSFAIKFGDSDIAKEFKEKFEKCQQEMKLMSEGTDKPEAAAAGDEAAAALAALTTNDTTEEKTSEVEKNKENEEAS